MKKVIQLLLALAFAAFLPVTAYGLTVFSEDYEGYEAGADPDGAWNWTGDAVTANASTVEEHNGSMWRQMAGTVDSASGTSGRYGYKVDIAMTGENTSANESDYFVEFDVVNLEGDWETVTIQMALLTANEAEGTGRYGYSFPGVEVAQGDGVVHVKYQLDEHTGNWWEGTAWDLTATTWAYEIGMPATTVEDGASFTQKILIDNFRVVYGSDEQPYNPVVEVLNDDGSSGALISQTEVEATLTWYAGGDPDLTRQYTVNPDIVGHYIYLSTGAPEDPNLYLVDYVEQVVDADPSLTAPENQYGPLTLLQGTEYTWQIEEAIDYDGVPSEAGDPNNILGLEWTFTTVGAVPVITAGPDHALADDSGNASFVVTCGPAATDYRWFKVGDPDVELSDGGIFSGTSTNTLVITGASISDEGEYYSIAYNGDPDNGGLASEPSVTAKLWTRRLMSHYTFEDLTDGVTPDSISGFDLTMASDDEGTDLPILADGMAELAPDAYGLSLDNSDSEDPEHYAQYAIAPEGIVDYADITISVWVYWNGGNAWQRILDFGNSTDEYIFMTPSNGGEARFAIKAFGDDETATEIALATTAIAEGEWTLMTATLSGDTGRLYINGELKATETVDIDPIDFSPTLNNYIGKSQYEDPYFNGIIDDLKIYSYARSTEQIAQDYLSLKGGWVCNNELYDLPYDYDGNCQIDIGDFAYFAGAWLDSYRIFPDSE